METPTSPQGMGCFSIVSFAASALLWIVATLSIFSLGESDAAGNGLASAFAILLQILLWIPLFVFLLTGASDARLPGSIVAAATILVPVAAVASISAVAMMGRPTWIAATPILLPPLAIAFGFWMRRGAPLSTRQLRRTTAGFGTIALLLLLPPVIDFALWKAAAPEREATMRRYQEQVARTEAEAEAAREARLAALGPDTPFEEFLDLADSLETRDRALAKLREIGGFEADAIRMLDADALLELRDLRDFGIEPDAALCSAYRRALDREFDRYPPPRPDYQGNPPAIWHQMRNFEWLVSEGCDLSAPLERLAAYLRQLPQGLGVVDLSEQIEPLLRKGGESAE